MRKITDNAYQKRIGYINLYILKGNDGDILIDTGFVFAKPFLKKIIKKYNIKMVILTHAHVDHSWNAAYIKKKCNAKIVLGEKDLPNIDNSKIHTLPARKQYTWWANLMNRCMKIFKQEYYEPDITFNEDTDCEYYGLKFKIVMLGGHTDGSIGVLYNNYFFIGDILVNRKKYAEIAYQNQNNHDSLMAVEKIIDLKPKVLYLGHDRPVKYEKLLNSRDFIRKNILE